ncbi:hypothetical protein [Bifidobacterium sp.]|jgi:hypothetical protein|uniref:hypothetical protein n=1 Tax=Bifidobacterium sp. TaxID=41200 RepID=UPI0025BE9508|nr:hypothetical protein [Bifidobacterium sp.]MCI1635842.1 hypothetical protein [Bifidobacterium sp.]
MFKRLFWIGVGVTIGVVTASKARAYVKAHTPVGAREFVFGRETNNVAVSTALGLYDEFQEARKAREAELNGEYIERTR